MSRANACCILGSLTWSCSQKISLFNCAINKLISLRNKETKTLSKLNINILLIAFMSVDGLWFICMEQCIGWNLAIAQSFSRSGIKPKGSLITLGTNSAFAYLLIFKRCVKSAVICYIVLMFCTEYELSCLEVGRANFRPNVSVFIRQWKQSTFTTTWIVNWINNNAWLE